MLKNGSRKIMVFVFYNKAIAFLQEQKPCMSSKNPAIHSVWVPKFRLRCSRQCSLELHGVRACTVQSACVARSTSCVVGPWCELWEAQALLHFSLGLTLVTVVRNLLLLPTVSKSPHSLTQSYRIVPHGLGEAVALGKVFLASGYSPKGQSDLSVPRQDVSHTGSRTHCLFPSRLLSLSRLSPFLPTG